MTREPYIETRPDLPKHDYAKEPRGVLAAETIKYVAILERHDRRGKKAVIVPDGQSLEFDADDATRRWLRPSLGRDYHLVEFLPVELAAPVASPPMQVKALEWQKSVLGNTLSRADTILGEYRVWTHHEAGGRWFWDRGEAFSEEAAKAAAQADYEQRIRSALVASPSREEVQITDAMVNAVYPYINGSLPLEERKAFARAALRVALRVMKAGK